MKKQIFALFCAGILLLCSCSTPMEGESSSEIESSSSEKISSLLDVSSKEIVSSQIDTSSKEPYEFTYPTKSLTEYLNAPPTNVVYTNKVFENYEPVEGIETYEEDGILYHPSGMGIPETCTIDGVFSYNVKVEYPVFSGISNEKAEDKLNLLIEEVAELENQFIEMGYYYFNMSYEVYCLNSKFVSIMFSIQTEGVGLNFQWYGYSILLDLETGENLQIGDFLELSEDSLKKIVDDRNTDYAKDMNYNDYEDDIDFRKSVSFFCDKEIGGGIMSSCSGFSPEDGGKVYVFLKMSGNLGKGFIFEVPLSELEGYYY